MVMLTGNGLAADVSPSSSGRMVAYSETTLIPSRFPFEVASEQRSKNRGSRIRIPPGLPFFSY
jgi:hypothetical protein